ncbi:MAG: hypothetical protein NTZ17_01250 [Phycisphaerae bacterium]|nr:hypothetical protein [Phycisphaerae bacterium]
MVTDEIRIGMANLHDAFLNCSLLRRSMESAPLCKDADTFHMSDRARYERLWVASLAVLIEAWRSGQMIPVVSHIRQNTDIGKLTQLLRGGEKDGSIAQIRETRHYMFHRDKREYWDDGRLGPVGNLKYNMELHDAFSHVLLNTMRCVMECDKMLGIAHATDG